MIDFCRETQINRTRKAHRCSGCRHSIEAGSAAITWAGKADGDFSSAYYHPECRAAEIAMNREAGTCSDEWCGLSEVRDMDLEDWLLAEHPIAAQRVGLTDQEASA